MNSLNFLVLSFAVLLTSCGGMSPKNIKDSLATSDEVFNYTDKNGQFVVKMSSGLNEKGKSYVTKRVMEIRGGGKDKTLEQSVAISTLGAVGKKKVMILRPKLSQYNVWFDGKKYVSELKLNPAKRAIDVKMTSPEAQWNGTKQIKFPSSKTLPCFFSQIIECAKVSGFIQKASEKKKGVMHLLIIWEGYPYLNETFSDFPSDLFSEAELEYDGKTKSSERRFNLRVLGQSIFYILNEKNVMTKMFWVSQGISMVSKSAGSSEQSDDGEEIE
jgi:hypothetical protein